MKKKNARKGHFNEDVKPEKSNKIITENVFFHSQQFNHPSFIHNPFFFFHCLFSLSESTIHTFQNESFIFIKEKFTCCFIFIRNTRRCYKPIDTVAAQYLIFFWSWRRFQLNLYKWVCPIYVCIFNKSKNAPYRIQSETM